MKKFVLQMLALCVSYSAFTQDVASKVPATSSVVIKYTGAKLTESVPIEKIDNYEFVKRNILGSLGLDSTASLESTGINFQKDTYQYFESEDSTHYIVTLVALKDASKLLSLLHKNHKTEIFSLSGQPHQFISLTDDKYLGWTSDMAALVSVTRTRPGDYYYAPISTDSSYYNYDDDVDSTQLDVPEILEDPEYIPPAPPTPPQKEKSSGNSNSTKTDSKKKTSKAKPEPEPEPEEEVIVEDFDQADPPCLYCDSTDSEYKFDYDYDYSYTDSIELARQEAWRKQRDEYIVAKQKETADSIIKAIFTQNYASVNTVEAYHKTTDPAAHVSAWVDYDNIVSDIWGSFSRSLYGIYAWDKPSNAKNKGFTTGLSLYFEKEQVRVAQKMYAPDAETTRLGKEMYKSKQSSAIAGLINPDHIAYFSTSFNTEAVGKYYYEMLRRYLSNMPYLKEYADLVDIYIDLMEIAIDEKGIAEVVPGNMAFVLHDLKPKTITYKDYEYDDDFNRKELTKTKQELAPNFSFIMATRRSDFMRKLAAVPVKYAAKHKFNYTEKGGYYELAFDAEKDVLSALYFVVKDDKVVVSTSKEVVEMALTNKSYKLDGAIKKSIMKNNYSIKLHTDRLLHQLGPELSAETSKSIRNYLQENLGDISIESNYKDGMIQSAGTMAIKGAHKNSFEFIFNMVDQINKDLRVDKNSASKNLY